MNNAAAPASSLTMYSAGVPVLLKLLTSTRSWLDKAQLHAEQKKYDVNVLMDARLAPDMFPFKRQVQIATDHAKALVARLAGMDLPSWEDNEKTIDELRGRLDKAIQFVESVPADKIVGTELKEIAWQTRAGERRMRGDDFLRFYALPNFYFHVTTAYAILRHNGVDVGKADYLMGGQPRS